MSFETSFDVTPSPGFDDAIYGFLVALEAIHSDVEDLRNAIYPEYGYCLVSINGATPVKLTDITLVRDVIHLNGEPAINLHDFSARADEVLSFDSTGKSVRFAHSEDGPDIDYGCALTLFDDIKHKMLAGKLTALDVTIDGVTTRLGADDITAEIAPSLQELTAAKPYADEVLEAFRQCAIGDERYCSCPSEEFAGKAFRLSLGGLVTITIPWFQTAINFEWFCDDSWKGMIGDGRTVEFTVIRA